MFGYRIHNGSPWKWRTLGVADPGSGGPWEWRTLGVVNPGSGGPWEWRTQTVWYISFLSKWLNNCGSYKT